MLFYLNSKRYDDEMEDSQEDPELSIKNTDMVEASLLHVSEELAKEVTIKITYRFFLLYSIIFFITLLIWYIISSIKISLKKNKIEYEYILFYIGLCFIYHIGKYILKRRGRSIDRINVIPSFSLEILTEILMSSFYWINLRMFFIHFIFNSYIIFIIIIIIHLGLQIFECSIRCTECYFKITPKLECVK